MSNIRNIDWSPFAAVSVVVLMFSLMIFGIRCDIEKREKDAADHAACLTWQDEYRQCEPGKSDAAKQCRAELRKFRPEKCAPPPASKPDPMLSQGTGA